MPDWSALIEPLQSARVMVGVGLVSGALFVISVLGAFWALKRLPDDYLLREETSVSRGPGSHFGRIVRNAVGFVLLLVGIALLVLPGQGLLTLLAAVSLLDFPGKRRLERRLMARPKVLDAINRFRRRVGRPPLRSG